ncbi:indoleamine 2,3-dioxygenase gamma type [Amylocarpus encephaloides]|uniref:Indoleamine 2,3-dioxygenase n=1 Tax=Amylocarpus encephaloides TaxID=45428 RepID=A0A9P8BZE2_9HELO|nr:indoleamine 2,3-dioxygenase gamma type [Amylocarpus encephaloides]
MGSVSPLTFTVLRDTKPEDTTLPAFVVSTTRGFLPRQDPITKLPAEFDILESILSRMPLKTADGSPGLLQAGTLGETVLIELPDLTWAVNKYADNLPLQNALYRDYSFLASAYLLEPCHERYMKGEEYGLGRQTLPTMLSLPIARCAELAGFKPFMEYAGSYALFNYRLEDPKRGLEYDNLRLIRAFENGLDPKSSEAGFVLVHIDMVQNSGPLVEGVVLALDACAASDRGAFNDGMDKVATAMIKVNKVMETMWGKSKPSDYNSFRTFIFGITSQSMFPHGVVYEGVSEEPLSFRGESGANDSMIPLCDNLLQITMPDTPLTNILQDFRSYRPGNHREFLEYVKDRSLQVALKSYALQDASSSALYILAMNQVRDFRWRHWCFTREYILKKTSHPTATGGSPIVTWLPNQLQAVIQGMVDVYEANGKKLGEEVDAVMEQTIRQREMLSKEVEKYCKERNVGSN